MVVSTTKNSSPKASTAFLYMIYPDGSSIDERHVNIVKDKIKNATVKTLNLVIESRGGDPYSAVKIVRVLRRKFEALIGIVPHYAMSAATLMLLGTDEIYMSDDSQLGPLDLPIEHPTDGSIISALDVVNALSQLGSTATVLATDRFLEMRNPKRGIRLGKNLAAKIAFESAVETVKPVIDKLDPLHIQRGFRELKIGQWYAFDLLRTGMMKGRTDKAWDTATKFVHYFPDHSYAIFKEEAETSLNLAIKEHEKLTDWDKVCDYVETRKSILKTTFIEYMEQ